MEIKKTTLASFIGATLFAIYGHVQIVQAKEYDGYSDRKSNYYSNSGFFVGAEDYLIIKDLNKNFNAAAIGNVSQNSDKDIIGAIARIRVMTYFGVSGNKNLTATASSNIYLTDKKNGNVWGALTHLSDDDYLPSIYRSYATSKSNIYLSNNVSVDAVIGAGVMARSHTESSMVAEGNIYLTDNTNVIDHIYATYLGEQYIVGRVWDHFEGNNSTLKASGNVTINGNVKLGKFNDNDSSYMTEVWGSYLDYTPTYYQIFKGNTFSMGANPLTVSKLGNFENYHFYLNEYNKDAIANGTALVTVLFEMQNNNTVTNENGIAVTSSNKSNIKINGISAEGITKIGDTITLIDANNTYQVDVSFIGGDNTNDIAGLFNTPENNTVDVGLVGKADISYNINTDNTITATINDIRIDNNNVKTNVKPLAEGRLAGLQNTARGADLLLSSLGDNIAVGTFSPIAIVDGGVNKYNSGSHIDTRDYRIMIGSRYQIFDNFYAGLAAEYGRSNFDTYNEFNGKKIDGDGHSYNYGLSLFAKYSYELAVGVLYSDGALRFGRTSTEFNSNDIITGGGSAAYYKSNVNYVGGLVGFGYIYPLNQASTLDTSLHYFYTRLGSDSTILDGDKVNFDKSTSSRIQLKEQYSYQASESITFSLAGIYEYEFESDAKTNVSGIGIDAPSAKGSTGIMELGIKGTPIVDNQDFSINLNVRGYSGKRDGASIAAQVKYDF